VAILAVWGRFVQLCRCSTVEELRSKAEGYVAPGHFAGVMVLDLPDSCLELILRKASGRSCWRVPPTFLSESRRCAHHWPNISVILTSFRKWAADPTLHTSCFSHS
jgi:hypothetical protein